MWKELCQGELDSANFSLPYEYFCVCDTTILMSTLSLNVSTSLVTLRHRERAITPTFSPICDRVYFVFYSVMIRFTRIYMLSLRGDITHSEIPTSEQCLINYDRDCVLHRK